MVSTVYVVLALAVCLDFCNFLNVDKCISKFLLDVIFMLVCFFSIHTLHVANIDSQHEKLAHIGN